MKKARLFVLAAGMAALSSTAAALTESFTNNPSLDGWQIYGNSSLFQWDSTNMDLDVTWDSSQSNSYFYHPLGVTLTRNADFTIAFDLELTNAEASGYGFELAIGLFNFAEATNAAFQRSTGENSPDLVEFDYFPDVGYGATVWPLFVDANSDFNYNGSSDYAIYAPTLGDWYHVIMSYTAASQTMVTTMTNFEQTTGVIIYDPFASYFTDFHVDTFSISSYQDDGFGDSIYAQGAIANIAVTSCAPPIQDLTGALSNATWQAQFYSESNWLYTLQRTTDLQTWTNVSAAAPGNGTLLTLPDTNPPPNQAFYRVNASQP
jgi:hypothetical protein